MKLLKIIPLLIFIILTGIFFYPTIIKNRYPVPSDTLVGLYHPWRDAYRNEYPQGIPFKNFLITDPIRQQIPWRKFAVEELKRVRLPGWNPYSFSGTPFLSNIQAGTFYPFNVLFLILPFEKAWMVLIVLEPLLAGLFFYYFVRYLKLNVLASIFGAIVWSYSGFNVAWLTWGTITHVSLWLPLILLTSCKLIDSANKRRNILLTLTLAILISIQFFAGHAQISFYVLLVTLGYILLKFRSIKESSNSLIIQKIIIITVSFVLAGALISVQLIPLIQSFITSARNVNPNEWLKPGFFLPWKHLLQYIVPDFFGNPTTLNYWGEWNYGEFIGYIGVIPVILAISALFINGKYTLLNFWKICLVLALLLMLPTPIARLQYILNVPFISSLQPTRLTMVADFSLAILASFGLHHYIEKKNKKVLYINAVLIIVYVFLYILMIKLSQDSNLQEQLNFSIAKRNLILPLVLSVLSLILFIFHKTKLTIGKLIYSLLMLITIADLFRFGWKFLPFTPQEYFFPNTEVLSFLQAQPKPFRIMSIDKRIMPPNTSAFYNLETIEGYDPLYDVRYGKYLAALNRNKPDITNSAEFDRIVIAENIESPLLNLLNVTYILSLNDISNPNFIKVFQEGDTKVYQNQTVLPRIYLADKVYKINDEQEIINTLYNLTNSSQKFAVIERERIVESIPLDSQEIVDIIQYDSERIIIKAQTKQERLLVILNNYHPGWKVKVNDKKEIIFRVNYLFQGVMLAPGDSIVEVWFEPI